MVKYWDFSAENQLGASIFNFLCRKLHQNRKAVIANQWRPGQFTGTPVSFSLLLCHAAQLCILWPWQHWQIQFTFVDLNYSCAVCWLDQTHYYLFSLTWLHLQHKTTYPSIYLKLDMLKLLLRRQLWQVFYKLERCSKTSCLHKPYNLRHICV